MVRLFVPSKALGLNLELEWERETGLMAVFAVKVTGHCRGWFRVRMRGIGVGVGVGWRVGVEVGVG